VANTQAAKDAVADTFVPQTAAINRQSYEQPDVEYDGDPQFEPVENTTFSYCVNTPDSVLLVDNQYYCCHSAVWYVCGNPRGPWLLCDHVPDVIYTIPPSCPDYSCRYCYVYDSTPDILYCGYLPGYVGCYHYDGVVVYGTGFYYHPWYGHHYYPRPFTYGFDAHYDSYQNHWGFSVGLAFGGGDAWVGYRGDEVRHDDWFGHGGYRPAIIHDDRNVNIYRTNINNITINNRTDIHNAQYNVYNRRKDVRYDVAARPELRTPARDEVAHTEVAHNEAPRADEHAAPRSVDTRDNVYSDANGDVYRKTLDGWEKRDHNQWTPATPSHDEPNRTAEAPRETKVDHPAEKAPAEPDRSGLDRDFRARVDGEQRSRSEPAPREDHPSESSHDSGSSHSGGDAPSSDSHSGGGGSAGGNGNNNNNNNNNNNGNGNGKGH
jgi:uncharacterized membrane protein YgcG